MLTILLSVLILAVVYWVVMRLLAAFGVGDPISTVVQLIFVVILLLYLLSAVFGFGPGIRVPQL